MSFAGEELGLLGSAEWSRIRRVPLDKAVAMINMDMIGRIKDDKVYIGGVGTGSTLKAAVEQAARVWIQDRVFGSGYSSSDHTSFVTKKFRFCFSFLACTPTITSLPIPGEDRSGSGDALAGRGRDDGRATGRCGGASGIHRGRRRQTGRRIGRQRLRPYFSDRSQISARSKPA